MSTLAIAAAALLGLFYAAFRVGTEGAYVFWALGFAVMLPYASIDFLLQKRGDMRSRMFGFFVILCSCGVSAAGYSHLGLALLFISPVAYFGNLKLLCIGGIPILIWVAGVPNAELIQFFLSFPLRVIGAHSSAWVMSLAGFDAESAGTIVYIGGKEIAITSACSGIEQLEAMLLVGWLGAVWMHKGTLIRLAHFLTILPIILIFNCIRLVATLAGIQIWGDVMLSDGIHTGLGIALIFLIAAAFYGVGRIFPDDPAEAGAAAKKEGKPE